MKVLFCLPVYNEIESLEKVVEQISVLGYDLIITDGGSNDGTRQLIDKLNIHCIDRPGKGKGVGIRMALEYAFHNRYTHLAYVDSDMTYPIHQFDQLLSIAASVDMVVGVRRFTDITLIRRIANVYFSKLIRYVMGGNFSDVLSGMRVLRVEKFVSQLKADEFEIEPEMHCLSIKKKYSVKEFSIPYFIRLGESKIGFRAFFRINKLILSYLFNRSSE